MNWCNKEPCHEKTFKVVYMGPVKTDKSSPVPSAGSYGHGRLGRCSGLEVIKLFSCSTQLSEQEISTTHRKYDTENLQFFSA